MYVTTGPPDLPPRPHRAPNVNNELNMYVTTGPPSPPNINNELDMYVTTGPPGPQTRPSRASVEERTVERSQDGAYELAGGGRVLYDLSQRNVRIESINEQKTEESCCVAHKKKLGVTILVIIIMGVGTGVEVKFGILETFKTTANDTGR